MAQANISIEMQAPIQRVYEVITDFESYPEFLSNSKSVKILNKAGNEWQVEFKIDTIKTITYALNVHLTPFSGYSWDLIKGDFMKSNVGRWILEDRGSALTHATYEIEIGLGFLVPKSAVTTLINKSLPKMMQEFKERVE